MPLVVRSTLVNTFKLKYEPLERSVKHVLDCFKAGFGFDVARLADLVRLVDESPQARQTLKAVPVLAGGPSTAVTVQCHQCATQLQPLPAKPLEQVG